MMLCHPRIQELAKELTALDNLLKKQEPSLPNIKELVPFLQDQSTFLKSLISNIAGCQCKWGTDKKIELFQRIHKVTLSIDNFIAELVLNTPNFGKLLRTTYGVKISNFGFCTYFKVFFGKILGVEEWSYVSKLCEKVRRSFNEENIEKLNQREDAIMAELKAAGYEVEEKRVWCRFGLDTISRFRKERILHKAMIERILSKKKQCVEIIPKSRKLKDPRKLCPEIGKKLHQRWMIAQLNGTEFAGSESSFSSSEAGCSGSDSSESQS